MNCRARGLSWFLLLAALAAGPAHAKKYKGDVTDARSGRGAPATVKTKGGAAAVTATIRCKPAKGCPLAKKTKVRLASAGGQYHYAGTFTLRGSACSLDAFIYSLGFQGTYTCADGSVGSIGGFPGGGGGGGHGDGGGEYTPPRR